MRKLHSVVLAVIAVSAVEAESVSGTVLADPIDVTTCDLVRNPSNYENKFVRVRGYVRAAFEIFALVDESCPADNTMAGMVWLTQEDDLEKYYGGWSGEEYLQASYSGRLKEVAASLPWVIPPKIQSVYRDQSAKLGRRLRRKQGDDVDATLVGRFDFVSRGLLQPLPDGRYRFSPGFGHLGGYPRRLVIAAVERVGDARPR